MTDEAIAPRDETVTVVPLRPVKPPFVSKFVDKRQIEADLSWSAADMTGAMMKQASLFVEYGRLSAEAQGQVDKFKLALETAEAMVYRELRDDAVKTGTKLSEKQLESLVSVHPTVQAIKKSLNEAKQIEAMLKTTVEAFRQRKDMLVSQGLIMREEMRGETVIRGRDEAIKSQQDRIKDSLSRGEGGRTP